jgi:hypothetical protein
MKDDFDDGMELPDDELMGETAPSEIAVLDAEVEIEEDDEVLIPPPARSAGKARPAAAPKASARPAAPAAKRAAKPKASKKTAKKTAKPARAKKSSKKSAKPKRRMAAKSSRRAKKGRRR